MTIELTEAQWRMILQLMNGVAGMEGARVLLPIYDKIMAAMGNDNASKVG